MKRIQVTTRMDEAVLKMVDGNVGATTVVGQIMKKLPQDWIIQLAFLDDQEIYGPDIWICYKNVCDYDLDKFIDENKHNKLKGLLAEYKKQK
ncbi:MAG: hypothetical protein V3U54_07625 [Thermodesulfobacteriota bacterium]